MTSPFGGKRRRKGLTRGALEFLLGVAALFLFGSAIEFFWKRFDEWHFPWAYARSGKPTLTGTWVGMLSTAGGAQLAMYLDLRLQPIRVFGRRVQNVRSRARAARFEGLLRLCGGPAGEQRFTFDGSNDDAAASHFHLGLYPADSIPPDGFAPSYMRGRWNGRDSLALEASMYLQQGGAAVTRGDDPHTNRPAQIGMRRADESQYSALCAAVSRRLKT